MLIEIASFIVQTLLENGIFQPQILLENGKKTPGKSWNFDLLEVYEPCC